MDPETLQQLLNAIQQLNTNVHGMSTGIGQTNNYLHTLANAVHQNTTTIENATRAARTRRGMVNGATHQDAINDLNAVSDALISRVNSAFTKAGAVRATVRNSRDNLVAHAEEELARIRGMYNVYMRDHQNSNVQITDTREYRDFIRRFTSELGDAIGASNHAVGAARNDFSVGSTSNASIKMSDSYVARQNNSGGTDFVSIASPLAHARDDVRKLSKELGVLNTEVSNTSAVIKNLADNSKMANDILDKVNVTLDTTNNNLSQFNTLLSAAITAQTNQVNRSNQAMGSMRAAIKQLQASMVRLTKANTKLWNDIQNAKGSKNSFADQNAKNNERAKQVGFLALLIPALTKLLKKSTLTDLLKLVALKIGAGASGMGDHKVAGTIGLLAAPVLAGTITTFLARQLMRLGGKLNFATLANLGEALTKATSAFVNALRGLANFLRHPVAPLKAFTATVKNAAKGFWGGVKSIPGNIKSAINEPFYEKRLMRIDPKRYGAYKAGKEAGKLATMEERVAYLDQAGILKSKGGAKFDYRRNRAGKIVNKRQFDWAMKGMSKTAPTAGARATAKTMAKRVPVIGALIGAALEVPELINAGKQGKGALAKQAVASTAGVAGGIAGAAIGSSAGSAIGMAIGTAILPGIGTAIGGFLGGALGPIIGGVIGDVFGRTLAPALMEGFKWLSRPLSWLIDTIKGSFGSIVEHLGRLFKGLGRIGSALGVLLTPVAKGLGWIAGIITTGVMGAIAGLMGMLNWFVKGLTWCTEVIATALGKFSDWLLTLPIVGKWFQNNSDQTPSTEKVQSDVSKNIKKEEKKYTPGTSEYKKHAEELRKQYDEKQGKRPSRFDKSAEAQAYRAEREKVITAQIKEEASKAMPRIKTALASESSAIGTILPKNIVYDTKNGITAAQMSSLGLYGKIGAGNSIPYIAKGNEGKLKALDTFSYANGVDIVYTSAMGGHHKGGPRSHYAGQKVDVTTTNRPYTPEEYEEMWRKGYFGGKTGAIGYEYKEGQTEVTDPKTYRELYEKGKVKMTGNNHYDFSVTSSIKEALAQYNKAGATARAVRATEQTASSSIERNLAEIVNKRSKNTKQDRTRNIVLSAVDVTGSLGVWGITHLNNGVMSGGGK